MKLNLFGLHIAISTSALAQLGAFGASELDKAIVAAKKTELGAAIAGIVHDVEDPTKTGPEKMVAALERAMPVVLDYATRGGFAGVLADTEAFARQLIESTVADAKQTPAVKIAAALLRLLTGGR